MSNVITFKGKAIVPENLSTRIIMREKLSGIYRIETFKRSGGGMVSITARPNKCSISKFHFDSHAPVAYIFSAEQMDNAVPTFSSHIYSHIGWDISREGDSLIISNRENNYRVYIQYVGSEERRSKIFAQIERALQSIGFIKNVIPKRRIPPFSREAQRAMY